MEKSVIKILLVVMLDDYGIKEQGCSYAYYNNNMYDTLKSRCTLCI